VNKAAMTYIVFQFTEFICLLAKYLLGGLLEARDPVVVSEVGEVHLVTAVITVTVTMCTAEESSELCYVDGNNTL